MKKLLIITFGLVVILLIISPWLDNRKLHDMAILNKSKTDGTMNSDQNLICDYQAIWVPFGRWVSSCEGGYYVTFWGKWL